MCSLSKEGVGYLLLHIIVNCSDFFDVIMCVIYKCGSLFVIALNKLLKQVKFSLCKDAEDIRDRIKCLCRVAYMVGYVAL